MTELIAGLTKMLKFSSAKCKIALALAFSVVLFLPLEVYAQGNEVRESNDNLKFFGVDLGVVRPVGSAGLFYLPNTIAFADGAPEPYSNYFSAGITTNFYAGLMTAEGFEASVSFKITKVNYTNFAEGIIQSGVSDVSRSGAFSSYLLGSQVYLGQRLRPVATGKESLYFGIAADISALKHYSDQLTVPEDQTLSVSFIAGEEIVLAKDGQSGGSFTFRLQTEFVALASSERPRYIGLTFGIRQYLP